MIEFSSQERDANLKCIEQEIRENGFFSLASLELTESLEWNADLSETALREYFYQEYAAERYERSGNVLTPKGVKMSGYDVCRRFCLKHDELTFQELRDFEEGVYGPKSNLILQAALEVMLRVDENRFVACSCVNFDIEKADRAIEQFMYDADVIPLQEIDSFMPFPFIDGIPWNSFLLESYCRLVSVKFAFFSRSATSQHAGAIVRRSAGFTSLEEALAAVSEASLTELDAETIGKYLVEKCFICRRGIFVEEIAKAAQVLRTRKEMRK